MATFVRNNVGGLEPAKRDSCQGWEVGKMSRNGPIGDGRVHCTHSIFTGGRMEKEATSNIGRGRSGRTASFGEIRKQLVSIFP